MRSNLKTEEIETLETIARGDITVTPPRSHLEKLSRLDLIEPCAEGVCMTSLGAQVLVKRK